VALRLFADPTSVTNWGAMFAMASLSILPVMIVFFILQKYIVEGISTTGLKG
jgi:multiple sugar transport system permease protein